MSTSAPFGTSPTQPVQARSVRLVGAAVVGRDVLAALVDRVVGGRGERDRRISAVIHGHRARRHRLVPRPVARGDGHRDRARLPVSSVRRRRGEARMSRGPGCPVGTGEVDDGLRAVRHVRAVDRGCAGRPSAASSPAHAGARAGQADAIGAEAAGARPFQPDSVSARRSRWRDDAVRELHPREVVLEDLALQLCGSRLYWLTARKYSPPWRVRTCVARAASKRGSRWQRRRSRRSRTPAASRRKICVSRFDGNVPPTVLAENEAPSVRQMRQTSASIASVKAPFISVTALSPMSFAVTRRSPASPTSFAANAPGARARVSAAMTAQAAVRIEPGVTGSFRFPRHGGNCLCIGSWAQLLKDCAPAGRRLFVY